jgi:hypothetical protein
LFRLQVTIGSEDLKANHMIQQVFQFPGELEKYRSLVKLLEQEMDGSRLLVRIPRSASSGVVGGTCRLMADSAAGSTTSPQEFGCIVTCFTLRLCTHGLPAYWLQIGDDLHRPCRKCHGMESTGSRLPHLTDTFAHHRGADLLRDQAGL